MPFVKYVQYKIKNFGIKEGIHYEIKNYCTFCCNISQCQFIVACAPAAQQQNQQPAQQTQQSNQNQQSDQQNQQSNQQNANNSNNNNNQAAPAQNAPVAQPENIDGTYQGQDDHDQITLTVTGKTGTWTKLESDGDQKIKQVTFDPANQRMIIGDDVQIYTVNGNQITVDDTDFDPSDRIILSK